MIQLITIGFILFLYLFVIFILRITSKQYGILFRMQSFWIGLHYSKHSKRYCLNIIPCLTIWWTINGDRPNLKLM